MSAGQNIKIKNWRITNQPDNSVGGSVVTGTVTGYYDARLTAVPPSQLLLQQGLEVERTFNVTVTPVGDIRERDEIEVIAPTDHNYYGARFRVRGVTFSDFNPRDPRAYMLLSVSRSVIAHGRQ
jgi:hypothetical protein